MAAYQTLRRFCVKSYNQPPAPLGLQIPWDKGPKKISIGPMNLESQLVSKLEIRLPQRFLIRDYPCDICPSPKSVPRESVPIPVPSPGIPVLLLPGLMSKVRTAFLRFCWFFLKLYLTLVFFTRRRPKKTCSWEVFYYFILKESE